MSPSPHRRPPNRFVGRKAETASALAALERSRLVTVLGPAGVGKTRLASEIAANSDSAVLIEAADVRTVEGLAGLVAAAIGIASSGHQSTTALNAAIGRSLGERGPVLLVLDNLEQVVEPAAAAIGRWLEATSELRVLATSRERLNITGETVLELPPLDPASAVELFIERARAARVGYDPAHDDADAIAAIASRLDHMPLAIELAAARIPVLSPAQMLERLDKRFELLRSSARDLTPRQRTMRGAMDWGWDLLEPWERVALAQCGVFHGGFDLDAAEAVLQLPDGAPPVLDVVHALRDKSLVIIDAADDLRFAMYETVRDYARARLHDLDLDDTLARHRAHYLGLGERLAAGAVGPDAERCLARLATEEANLVAVHHAADGAETATRSALALEPLLSTRGPWEAWRRLVDTTVRAAADAPPLLHARALLSRGNLVRQQGQMDAARSDFAKGLELARAAGDAPTEAYALALLGIVARSVGDKPTADAQLTTALELAQRIGDKRTEAVARVSLGFLRLEQDRPSEAEDHSRRALALARAIGDRNVEGIAIVQLANLLVDAGQLEDGVVVYTEALQLAERTANHRTAGMVLANRAHVRIEQGQLARAEPELERALALSRAVGNRRFVGIALGYQSLLARERGDLAAALVLVDQALAVHRDMGTVRWISEELRNRGVLHFLKGQLDAALADFSASLAESGTSGLTLQDGRAEALIATAQAERDDIGQAEATLSAARTRFDTIDDNQAPVLLGLAEAHIVLAHVRAGTSQPTIAITRLSEATPAAASSAEVRVAIRLLQRRLDDMDIAHGEGPAGTDALIIGPAARWFQPPHEAPVDVSRRRILRRILGGLVDAREKHPGVALAMPDVLEAGWPGEKILPEAAQNRVYVAIATLRKLGLGDVLLTRKDGYLLDSTVPLERSS